MIKLKMIESVFYILFSVIVFFPFIPPLIPSSDTQPFLTLVFILYLLIGCHFVGTKLKIVLDRNIYFLLFFIFVVLINFVLNYSLFSKVPVYSRYFAFIQFLIAVFLGLFFKINFNPKWFTYVLISYSFFTVIYFLTNGLLENQLILSRDIESSDLFNIGRGARTLAPEPSFFALNLFNLFVINSILKPVVSNRIKTLNFSLLALLLLSSLSGYGILILFIILLVQYPKKVLLFSCIILLLFPVFFEKLQQFENFRSVQILIKILTENPLSLVSSDASIASRFLSFTNYIETIQDNLLLGDNFSVVEGGGLIGLISGLGLIGLIYSIILFIKIFNYILFPKLFIIIIFWFFLNFVSGPFGIPAFGIIIGLILRNKQISF
jgi:O-antigen ligase